MIAKLIKELKRQHAIKCFEDIKALLVNNVIYHDIKPAFDFLENYIKGDNSE